MTAGPVASGWYYSKRGSPAGQQTGPLTWEQLSSLAQTGQLGPDDLVWNPQLPDWLPAAQFPELFAAAAQPVAQSPYPAPAPAGAAYGQATQPAAAYSTGRRRSWLSWVVPLVVLIVVGAGLGAYFGFLRGGDGGASSTASSNTTVVSETTSTTAAVTTTTTLAPTTTTTTAETTTTTAETTTTTEVLSQKWGAAAEVNGLRITVSVPATDKDVYATSNGVRDDTMKVIMAEVVLENIGSTPHVYYASDFTLYDTSDNSYLGNDDDSSGGLVGRPGLRSGYLQPGNKIHRWVAYIVPADASAKRIEYAEAEATDTQAIWEYK